MYLKEEIEVIQEERELSYTNIRDYSLVIGLKTINLITNLFGT